MALKFWSFLVHLVLLGALLAGSWRTSPIPPNLLGRAGLHRAPVCIRGLSAEDRRQVTAALFFWSGVLDLEWDFREENAVLLVGASASPDYVAEGDRLFLAGYPANWTWAAYAQQKQNRAVFDDRDEESSDGRFEIAVHEIGHLLGLPHNPVRSSVMYRDVMDGNGIQWLTLKDLQGLSRQHRLRSVITGPVPVTYRLIRPPFSLRQNPLWRNAADGPNLNLVF